MQLYVRAKKDKDALEHVFRTQYGYVPEIKTLGGIRHGLEEAIEELPREDLTLVLLGREDRKWVKRDLSNAWRKVCFFDKAKIRNGRKHQLVNFLENCKTRFIGDVDYSDGGYSIGGRSFLWDEIEPGDDVLFLLGDEFKKNVEKLAGHEIPEALILHKRAYDVFYVGRTAIGILRREDDRWEDWEESAERVSWEKTVELSKAGMEEKVEAAINKIRSVLKERDEIVVPWSGGKDSTVVLALLKESKLEFTAIHVDTGLEFNETEEYVERLAKELKINLEIVRAPVGRKFRVLGEEYLQGRECTRDKVSTLYKYVRENFKNPILVNGDRITESKARSFRPDMYRDEFDVFSPIKYWSNLDEQIYLYLRGIPNNPLYERGFYRVGCKTCPFMDLFEKNIAGERNGDT